MPQAHDRAFASGFGDLSVHEVAMSHNDARLAYFSYYAAGSRVARIVDDELVDRAVGNLARGGHMVAPARPTPAYGFAERTFPNAFHWFLRQR